MKTYQVKRVAALVLLVLCLVVQVQAQATPKDTFLSYIQTLAKANSIKELEPFWTKERSQAVPGARQTEALVFLKKMAPQQIQVLKETVKGAEATLNVKAMVTDLVTNKAAPSTGTIELKKEGGSWRIGKESWT